MGKTEFDKIAKEKEMNIDEEMLNFVAGGIYTKEEWDNLRRATMEPICASLTSTRRRPSNS